jgi:DNA-binding MarR family transcriptional regulator
MTHKASGNEADRTPLSRLTEGALRGIVGYQLAQAQIVTDGNFDERARRPANLRQVEFTILALVRANPGLTARQLARALAVTPPNIAIWLERLESRALLTRTRSAKDGRLQHVELTAAGGALIAQTTQSLIQGERAMLQATLSEAEQAMLVELLHKMALGRRRGEA